MLLTQVLRSRIMDNPMDPQSMFHRQVLQLERRLEEASSRKKAAEDQNQSMRKELVTVRDANRRLRSHLMTSACPTPGAPSRGAEDLFNHDSWADTPTAEVIDEFIDSQDLLKRLIALDIAAKNRSAMGRTARPSTQTFSLLPRLSRQRTLLLRGRATLIKSLEKIIAVCTSQAEHRRLVWQKKMMTDGGSGEAGSSASKGAKRCTKRAIKRLEVHLDSNDGSDRCPDD